MQSKEVKSMQSKEVKSMQSKEVKSMQSKEVESMQSKEIMILRSHIAALEQYNQYLLESLDDLSKKAYDLSFEIINKGTNRMSAHEEYPENLQNNLNKSKS